MHYVSISALTTLVWLASGRLKPVPFIHKCGFPEHTGQEKDGNGLAKLYLKSSCENGADGGI